MFIARDDRNGVLKGDAAWSSFKLPLDLCTSVKKCMTRFNEL